MEDFAPGIETAFATAFTAGEQAIEVLGRLPSWLHGKYYLIAPGKFTRKSQRHEHWLDGDGILNRLHFERGRAHFTNRFIQTSKFLEEQKADQFLFRGFDSPGERLNTHKALATPANVSICTHAGKLLVFGEQALPWELDSSTLETRSEFDFGGQISGWNPLGAHHKQDPRTKELFCFGVLYSPVRTDLILFRFDRKQRLIYRTTITLPAAHYIHDFAMSERHLVFHLSPYHFDLNTFLKGASFLGSLQWKEKDPSQLLICDRQTGQTVKNVPCPNGFSVHTINAFEQEDQLCIDLVEFERPFYEQLRIPTLFQDAPHGQAVRRWIPLKTPGSVREESLTYKNGPDFPHVAASQLSQPYTHFWALGMSQTGKPGRKFYDQLLAFDWAVGTHTAFQCETGQFLCGEPVYCPADKTDDAVVICQGFQTQPLRSFFWIFRAHAIAEGPVCTLGLERPIPLGLHATFSGLP